MRKNAFSLISLVLAALSFSSCEIKEVAEPDNAYKRIKTLSSVIDETETRIAISGSDETGYDLLWSEGDDVAAVNFEDYGASDIYALTEGAGTKYGKFTCEGEGLDHVDYAIYPADVFSGDGFDEQLVWPDVQKYDSQKITSPMYGIPEVDASGNMVIRYRHLGGFMRLTVNGNSTIKKIRITAKEAMSGIGRILDFGGVATAEINGSNEIVVDCGDGVDVSGGKDFYVALPSCDFTQVMIECYDVDDNIVCTRKLKDGVVLAIYRGKITQVSLNILPYVRVMPENGCQAYLNDDTSLHQLNAAAGTKVKITAVPDPGYIFIGWNDGNKDNPRTVTVGTADATYRPMLAMSGGYRISDTGMVRFAKGNLTYDVKAGEWGFFEHQYDLANGYSANRISLFTWGYGIWSTNPSTESYSTGQFQDWGDAMDDEDTWRTLTKAEWEYLAKHHKMTWAQVFGACGYILEPVGFTGTISKVYRDEDSWLELESAGCVFLPAAGYRRGTSLSNDLNVVGYYWTADEGSYADDAYQLYIADEYFRVLEYTGMRYRGCSVRLVNEVPAE